MKPLCKCSWILITWTFSDLNAADFQEVVLLENQDPMVDIFFEAYSSPRLPSNPKPTDLNLQGSTWQWKAAFLKVADVWHFVSPSCVKPNSRNYNMKSGEEVLHFKITQKFYMWNIQCCSHWQITLLLNYFQRHYRFNRTLKKTIVKLF